jgi:hypothetical protein
MFFIPTKLMRFPRVKANGHGFYHCVSRVVEGRFIFQVSGHGSVEAERFIKLMRRLEAFSGVRVLTYVLMSGAKGKRRAFVEVKSKSFSARSRHSLILACAIAPCLPRLLTLSLGSVPS